MARSTHSPSISPQRPLKSRFLVDLAMHRNGLREMHEAKLAALEARITSDSVSRVGEPL